jgi:hypothetical protein
LIVLLVFPLNPLKAQKDSLTTKKDTSVFSNQQPSLQTPKPPIHSPKKAAILSAILPGAGQAYNHKYWKMPVIYAGFAGLGYFFAFEETRFDLYSNAYQQSVKGNTNLIDPSIRAQGYDTQQLLDEKMFYNRYRDLAFIGCTALYLLNIVDAAVDAHFWHFKENMSDDLTFHIKPSCLPVAGSILPVPALRLSLSFR